MGAGTLHCVHSFVLPTWKPSSVATQLQDWHTKPRPQTKESVTCSASFEMK